MKDPYEMTDAERSDLLKELKKDGAGCLSIALQTGYIRVYEEGEERCQCHECKDMNHDF